jgi:hypothetical protein
MAGKWWSAVKRFENKSTMAGVDLKLTSSAIYNKINIRQIIWDTVLEVVPNLPIVTEGMRISYDHGKIR